MANAVAVPRANDPEKRKRSAYSRVICLGCRDRRIRCELPSDVEIPNPGEVSTTKTPCYRCKRLAIPCRIRQTVLGRPGAEHTNSNTAVDTELEPARNVVPHVIVELSSPTPSHVVPEVPTPDGKARPQPANELVLRPSSNLPKNQERAPGHNPLIHIPQSPDATLIIYARSTMQSHKVEDQWFRHLPARVGYFPCLDLSVKATVTACALARKVPYVTSHDCYQALALALNALHVAMRNSDSMLDDHVLASTALLAPFDGTIKHHGIPTRLHIEGLAAIIKGRPQNYPVSQLARDIVDFQICDTAITACIRGVPSPFENIPSAYYTIVSSEIAHGHRCQLKSMGAELFVRIPRLIGLVRALRVQAPFSVNQELLSDAKKLCRELLMLRNRDSESFVFETAQLSSEGNVVSSILGQCLYFTDVEDYEALMYYWSNRLCLLRLERYLQVFCANKKLQLEDSALVDNAADHSHEASQVARRIILCTEYTAPLPLNRHRRLYAYASVLAWGALNTGFAHLPMQGEESDLDVVADVLARGVSRAVYGTDRMPDRDMDAAADLFLGGLPSGKITELFRDAL